MPAKKCQNCNEFQEHTVTSTQDTWNFVCCSCGHKAKISKKTRQTI